MSLKGKWTRTLSAAALTVSSLTVAPQAAQAQGNAYGYGRGMCPVIDTDPYAQFYKEGYVKALDDARRSVGLRRAYFCYAHDTPVFWQGYDEGKRCVKNALYRSRSFTRMSVNWAVDSCHYEVFSRYPNNVMR